jgi:antitoxin (DNA-binding transcriptional repressor) of toxin-antitoxin stability system
MPKRSTRLRETDATVNVQVAELKTRLSEYIRVAEAGQTVVVTAYGRPVVDLVRHRVVPPVRIRPATRAWGSVTLPRTGKGRTDSLALLVEDRRKR